MADGLQEEWKQGRVLNPPTHTHTHTCIYVASLLQKDPT